MLTGFFSGLEPLKEKIDVLVLQLPPSLKFNEAKPRLEILLKHLPHYCRFAIEGRHESWFYDEAIDFLKQNNICLVWSEVPMVDNPAPITTNFIYVRLIGDRNLPEDVYDHKVRDKTDVIQKWADKIQTAQKNEKIKFSWVLLNNHLEGFAPATANSLRSILGFEELIFRDRNQKSVFDY